jgi:hypothetical protein
MSNDGWRESIFLIVAAGMFALATACGPSESELQTAAAQTAAEFMTLEATMNTPTNTPVPSETPIPPTETPIPTPTEVKVAVMDEEGDCEVVTGGLGEEGCQVDLASVTLFPCEKPGRYTFRVEFHTLRDANTTDVCLLINEDGNPDTGFEANGFPGIGIVYCWVPESREVLVDRFDADGSQQQTLSVASPLQYIVGNPDRMVETREFGITFPPRELGSIVIDSTASAVIEVLHYDSSGNMIHDSILPIGIIGCPTE